MLRRASALRMSHDEDAAAELARRVRVRAASAAIPRPSCGRTSSSARRSCGARWAVLRWRRHGGRPRRRRRGVSSRRRPGRAATRRSKAGGCPARDRHDRLRAWARVVRRRGDGRSRQRVPGGRRPGAISRTLLSARHRAAPDRGEGRPGTGARHLRTARRPDRVSCRRSSPLRTRLRAGDAPGGLGEAPRGDPPGDRRLSAVVTESERERLDLQMLFGVHVYSRAKLELRPRHCPAARTPTGRPGSRVIGRSNSWRRAASRCSLLELGDLGGRREVDRSRRHRGVFSRRHESRTHPARDLARQGPGPAPVMQRACAIISGSRWRVVGFVELG